MSDNTKKNTLKSDWQVWLKIIRHMKPLRGRLILAFMGSAAIAGIDVGIPLLNLYAINRIITEGDVTRFKYYIAAYIALVIAQLIFVYVFIKSAGQIQVELAYILRDKAFKKLQKLSFSYFDKVPIGSIMSRMTSDAGNLSDILSWSIIELLLGVLTMLGISVAMLMMNWKLGLIALASVPFMIYISLYFKKKILSLFRKVRKINAKINAAYNEGIMGAITTKTLVIEDVQLEAFEGVTRDMQSKSVQAAMFSGLYYPSIMFLSGISTVFVLYYGGVMVADQVILVGTLYVFIRYMKLFFNPIMQMADILAKFQQAQASAERVMDLIDLEPEVQDTESVIAQYGDEFQPKKEHWETIQGDIEFDHVDFRYEDGSDVLSDFSLKVRAGESIAIVGHTGSGKSTIVNLICRFYEPVSGSIAIDGKDYRERSVNWLHHQIGYVLQSPQLFKGTIAENIGYGKDNATAEEVAMAARYIGADSFIESFDKGYETQVGEGGSRLSVGQKQLISFARALIADPRIMILDEATSSVDTETEKLIQQGIDKMLKNRTSFVIAHRLSTIKNCDRILVLKEGRVIEEGTHEDLIGAGGHYYQLFTNQFAVG